MRAVKCILQNFTPSEEILELEGTFRAMVNEAIRVGIESNLSSRFKLYKTVYSDFHKYGLHTHYIVTSCEKAASLLKNYRREKRENPNARVPYVWKGFVAIDNQSYSVRNGILRFAIQPKHFQEISLTSHTQDILSDPSLRLGSIILTARTVVISYSKEIAQIEPSGYIGIDRNLENCTTASSDGEAQVFDTSRITQAKESYSEVKSHFRRNDHRIRKQIYSKYGEKQTEIENQELHKISKEIVQQAKELNFGIVMENIKGIRKLYRKGNGQGRKYRMRLNSWSFFKLAKMIEYKAMWEGLKIIYVNPQKTSSTCATCGSKVVECAERKVWCPSCGTLVDRDANAARNILARGLRFSPIGLAGEAMKGNETPTPILLADAGKSRSSET